MNRGLSIVVLLLVVSVLPAVSIYAWQMTQIKPETLLVEFNVSVNEQKEVILYIPVDLNDGISKEDCELIAEKVFTEIMGDAMHRLDKLSINGSKMDASYTWGINENDMSHFFDISGDVASHALTVTHCR